MILQSLLIVVGILGTNLALTSCRQSTDERTPPTKSSHSEGADSSIDNSPIDRFNEGGEGVPGVAQAISGGPINVSGTNLTVSVSCVGTRLSTAVSVSCATFNGANAIGSKADPAQVKVAFSPSVLFAGKPLTQAPAVQDSVSATFKYETQQIVDLIGTDKLAERIVIQVAAHIQLRGYKPVDAKLETYTKITFAFMYVTRAKFAGNFGGATGANEACRTAALEEGSLFKAMATKRGVSIAALVADGASNPCTLTLGDDVKIMSPLSKVIYKGYTERKMADSLRALCTEGFVVGNLMSFADGTTASNTPEFFGAYEATYISPYVAVWTGLKGITVPDIDSSKPSHNNLAPSDANCNGFTTNSSGVFGARSSSTREGASATATGEWFGLDQNSAYPFGPPKGKDMCDVEKPFTCLIYGGDGI